MRWTKTFNSYYTTPPPQGDVNIDVVLRDDTIWLTQKAMAALFGVQPPAINKHLRNIFDEGELEEEVVISKMETTTAHGAISGKTNRPFAQSLRYFIEYGSVFKRSLTASNLSIAPARPNKIEPNSTELAKNACIIYMPTRLSTFSLLSVLHKNVVPVIDEDKHIA